MENNYTKIYIVVGSVLTIIVVAVLQFAIPDRSSLPAVLSPILYTVVSLVALKLMPKSDSSSILKLNNAVMLSNMGKMVVYAAYLIIVYLNLEQIQKMTFVIVFMLLYVVFSVLDINVRLRMIRNNKQNGK